MSTRLETAGGVATLTLDNPQARNALDDATRLQLLDGLRAANSDAACRVIVLTGAAGTFCAGGDLPSMPTEETAIRRRMGQLGDIARLVNAGPKPVAVAVEGTAFGSGLSLTAAAEYAVASRDARFGCAFGRVGLIGDTGLNWTLPQRVGHARARRIAVTNAIFDADRAYELGVVDELCEPGEALTQAYRWAAQLLDTAPRAVAATRGLFARALPSLDDVLDAEVQTQLELLNSRDFAEGRQAFFDKRRPTFTGE